MKKNKYQLIATIGLHDRNFATGVSDIRIVFEDGTEQKQPVITMQSNDLAKLKTSLIDAIDDLFNKI
jgi:hypothetical protein